MESNPRSLGRLRKAQEFKDIVARGTRSKGEHLELYLCQSDRASGNRVGITIRRRLGPAVARNRCKRLLREVFRLHREQIPPGSDLVVAVIKDLSRMKLREVEAVFCETIMKIGSPGRIPGAEGVHGNLIAGEKVPARGN